MSGAAGGYLLRMIGSLALLSNRLSGAGFECFQVAPHDPHFYFTRISLGKTVADEALRVPAPHVGQVSNVWGMRCSKVPPSVCVCWQRNSTTERYEFGDGNLRDRPSGS